MLPLVLAVLLALLPGILLSVLKRSQRTEEIKGESDQELPVECHQDQEEENSQVDDHINSQLTEIQQEVMEDETKESMMMEEENSNFYIDNKTTNLDETSEDLKAMEEDQQEKLYFDKQQRVITPSENLASEQQDPAIEPSYSQEDESYSDPSDLFIIHITLNDCSFGFQHEQKPLFNKKSPFVATKFNNVQYFGFFEPKLNEKAKITNLKKENMATCVDIEIWVQFLQAIINRYRNGNHKYIHKILFVLEPKLAETLNGPISSACHMLKEVTVNLQK